MVSDKMETQYLTLVQHVLDHGDARQGRNGVVHSVFGASLECDCADGFPLLTTKKMFWKGIVEELAWFLRGSTNVQELRDQGVHIWDGNSEDRAYDAGPVYGFQWRHFGATYTDCHADYHGQGTDQIGHIIHLLKTDPTSRRIVLSGWCPPQQHQMCLPPCHVLYQFYVEGDGRVSVQMYQRSSDIFLGLPFNIASTALLLTLIAHQVGRTPGRVRLQLGDAHIYDEHVDACRQQLAREPRALPTLNVQRTTEDTLWSLQREQVQLVGYTSAGRLAAKMKA
jgi:thymidylate synthase|tara:strand:- start:155 stop:997 length:843 start_codon:yes stop_codon:yes gene_type:complete